jgi:hypothetical protein
MQEKVARVIDKDMNSKISSKWWTTKNGGLTLHGYKGTTCLKLNVQGFNYFEDKYTQDVTQKIKVENETQ